MPAASLPRWRSTFKSLRSPKKSTAAKDYGSGAAKSKSVPAKTRGSVAIANCHLKKGSLQHFTALSGIWVTEVSLFAQSSINRGLNIWYAWHLSRKYLCPSLQQILPQ